MGGRLNGWRVPSAAPFSHFSLVIFFLLAFFLYLIAGVMETGPRRNIPGCCVAVRLFYFFLSAILLPSIPGRLSGNGSLSVYSPSLSLRPVLLLL